MLSLWRLLARLHWLCLTYVCSGLPLTRTGPGPASPVSQSQVGAGGAGCRQRRQILLRLTVRTPSTSDAASLGSKSTYLAIPPSRFGLAGVVTSPSPVRPGRRQSFASGIDGPLQCRHWPASAQLASRRFGDSGEAVGWSDAESKSTGCGTVVSLVRQCFQLLAFDKYNWWVPTFIDYHSITQYNGQFT